MNTNSLTVAEQLVNNLLNEGVDQVFGVVGSHVVSLFSALEKCPEIQVFTAHHENAAALMAGAYTALTGKTGVLITTAGPGVLNALNGLAQAEYSQRSVVCIAGGVTTCAPAYELHGSTQPDDMLHCTQAIVKYGSRLVNTHLTNTLVSEVFYQSRSRRPGVSYLEVPIDVLDTPSCDLGEYKPKGVSRVKYDIHHADDVLNKIQAADNPLLVVDDVHHVNHATISELLTQCQVPYLVTRDALNYADETSENFCGVLHEHRFGPWAIDALQRADLIVSIGVAENSANSHRIGGKYIALDKETQDGADIANLLGHSLAKFKHSNSVKPYKEIAAGRLAALKQIRQRHQSHPFVQVLSLLTQAYANQPALFVLDAGTHEVWARTLVSLNKHHQILSGNDWATMGFALATATGARMVTADLPIICVTGDGCLLMSLMDLPNLIQQGGATTIVNLNDAAYGMMADYLPDAPATTQLPTINYAQMAQLLGAKGITINNNSNLQTNAWLNTDQPVFLDVAVQEYIGYPEFVA